MTSTIDKRPKSYGTYELPKASQRYYDLLVDITEQRVWVTVAAVFVGVVCFIVNPLLIIFPILLWMPLALLPIPSINGHGIDWVIKHHNSRRKRRQDGVTVQRSINPLSRFSKSVGYKLDLFPLYDALEVDEDDERPQLGVIFNPKTGMHTLFIEVVAWPHVATEDEPERISSDFRLARILGELTSPETRYGAPFEKFGFYTVSRTPSPVLDLEFVDRQTGGNPSELTVEMIQEIREAYEELRDFNMIFGVQIRYSSRSTKRKLAAGKWHEVSAVKVARNIMSQLRRAGMDVEIPSPEEVKALHEAIYNPANRTTADNLAEDLLVKKGLKEPGPLRRLMGSMSSQGDMDYYTVEEEDYLRCGESYHMFLRATGFKVGHYDAGIGKLDEVYNLTNDLLENGVGTWALASLMVTVEPMGSQIRRIRYKRVAALTKEYGKASKGSVLDPIEEQKIEEAKENFADVQLSNFGYASVSLAFMISGTSPAMVQESVDQLIDVLRHFEIKAEQIHGSSVMLETLETMIRLR